MKLLSLLTLLLCTTVATGQTLPKASRTVYKCEEGGKVNYSDSPCLGAKKLEVEPTRGLNKSSGREVQGRDVNHERFREAFADGIKPVTGLDAKQLDQAGRRQRLTPETQRQCRALDQQLPMAEAAEAAAKVGAELKAAQKRLLDARTSYRKLGCD